MQWIQTKIYQSVCSVDILEYTGLIVLCDMYTLLSTLSYKELNMEYKNPCICRVYIPVYRMSLTIFMMYGGMNTEMLGIISHFRRSWYFLSIPRHVLIIIWTLHILKFTYTITYTDCIRPWIFFRPYFHYCLSSAHHCEDHFHLRLLIIYIVWYTFIFILSTRKISFYQVKKFST